MRCLVAGNIVIGQQGAAVHAAMLLARMPTGLHERAHASMSAVPPLKSHGTLLLSAFKAFNSVVPRNCGTDLV